MIEDLLKNKTQRIKAQIKSEEIAKLDLIGTFKEKTFGLKIEIQSIKKIEGGIEILARAWKGTKQLGFGKDGTVEIERFKIYNPPVLVDDPNGKIVRSWIDFEGVSQKRKLREAPLEAIRTTLAHTVKVSSQEGNIIKGKIGNTTSTFYPSAGAVEPVDGSIVRQLIDETWATIRGATGNSPQISNANESIAWIRASTTTNQYQRFSRGVFGFTTSAIGSDTVTSATFSFVATLALDQMTGDAVSIDRNPPASTNNLVNGDYDVSGWDGVLQSDTETTLASLTADSSTYSDFALNTTGIGNVNTSGLSWFGTRIKADFDNIEPSWVSEAHALINAYTADQTGTATDPKLVVVHDSPTNYTTSVTEVLTSSDVLASVWGATENPTESMAVTEAVIPQSTFSQIVLSSFSGLTDTAEAVMLIIVSVLESFGGFSDSKETQTGFGVVTTETLALIDQLESVKGQSISILESFSLTESVISSIGFSETITETLNLIDDFRQLGWSWIDKNLTGSWTFIDKDDLE